MSRPIRITYTCKACDHKAEVKVYPIIPARTGGPPELCYPEEGGEVEPEECPECGAKFDQGDVHHEAEKAWQDLEVERHLSEQE